MPTSRWTALRMAILLSSGSLVVERLVSSSGHPGVVKKCCTIDGCDARDIEIVLGANVTNNSPKLRETQIWVIDFNQVAPFNCTEEQIPRLVEAFFANEAYFPRPRPSDELYKLFSQAYIAECAKIENAAVVLGRLFIDALEREQLARDQAN